MKKTLKKFASKEIKNTKKIKGGTELLGLYSPRYRGSRR
jgi:hypothetical protein